MNERQAVDTRAFACMLALCMTWGMQQVMLKAAAPDVSPVLQIALRSGISAALVGLLMAWRRSPLPLAGTWRPGLLVGSLFTAEFLVLGEGLRFTTASHIVVFLYTAPIFVALALHWRLPAERLQALQWAGILMAFAGIVVTFSGGWASGQTSAAMLWGDFLGLLAGLAWGATTVVVRCSRLASAPATLTLLYQLLCGFVGLLAAAALLNQWHFNPTPIAWVSLAFQGILVSFITYLTWFWLLQRYLASQLGVFSFMTPLFGIVFGVWLLDEPLEPAFVVGSLCVMTGIILVTGQRWLLQGWQRLTGRGRPRP